LVSFILIFQRAADPKDAARDFQTEWLCDWFRFNL